MFKQIDMLPERLANRGYKPTKYLTAELLISVPFSVRTHDLVSRYLSSESLLVSQSYDRNF